MGVSYNQLWSYSRPTSTLNSSLIHSTSIAYQLPAYSLCLKFNNEPINSTCSMFFKMCFWPTKSHTLENDTSLPRNHQHSIAPQLEVGAHDLLPHSAKMLTGWCCAGLCRQRDLLWAHECSSPVMSRWYCLVLLIWPKSHWEVHRTPGLSLLLLLCWMVIISNCPLNMYLY